MLLHLLQAGLPHIDDGQTVEVVLADLRRQRQPWKCSWPCSRALRSPEGGRAQSRVKAGHAAPPWRSAATAVAELPHDVGRAAFAPASAAGEPTTIGSGLHWFARLSDSGAGGDSGI